MLLLSGNDAKTFRVEVMYKESLGVGPHNILLND